MLSARSTSALRWLRSWRWASKKKTNTLITHDVMNQFPIGVLASLYTFPLREDVSFASCSRTSKRKISFCRRRSQKGAPIGAFVNRHKNFLPQLFLVFFVELLLLSDSVALGSDSNHGLLLIDSEFTAL